MSKYTKGPWHCHEKIGVYANDGKLVASVHTPISERSHDAHLIAAAPALLEALKACIDFAEDYGSVQSSEAVAKARAAIEAAHGIKE